MHLSYHIRFPVWKSIENCVSDIREWMDANRLKLNDSKTEAILFGRKHHASHISMSNVAIGDCKVNLCSSTRDLGVILDSELSMKDQIAAMCQSSHYHLTYISRIRKYLTKSATETLVHALISSRLDYGNGFLYVVPKFLIKCLQSVQNSAARIIARCGRYDHITPLLAELHWLPVSSRIIFKILLLTYKALHGLAPAYIRDLLHLYVPSRSLRSSSDVLLRIPRSRLVSCGDRTFSYCAPRLWNNLPCEIRQSESLATFKSSLKTYLYKDAYLSLILHEL